MIMLFMLQMAYSVLSSLMRQGAISKTLTSAPVTFSLTSALSTSSCLDMPSCR